MDSFDKKVREVLQNNCILAKDLIPGEDYWEYCLTFEEDRVDLNPIKTRIISNSEGFVKSYVPDISGAELDGDLYNKVIAAIGKPHSYVQDDYWGNPKLESHEWESFDDCVIVYSSEWATKQPETELYTCMGYPIWVVKYPLILTVGMAEPGSKLQPDTKDLTKIPRDHLLYLSKYLIDLYNQSSAREVLGDEL